MKIVSAALSALILLGASQASAQTRKVDLGKAEYDGKCAHCHGQTGKGDGPTGAFLTKRAPDLTGLAKANGGVLPVVTLYDAITGDKPAAGHGTREMPAWGNAYRVQAGEHYVDTPYDPEAYVRTRILLLIEYIHRLQVK